MYSLLVHIWGGLQGLAITNEAAGVLERLHISLCINIYFHLSWLN